MEWYGRRGSPRPGALVDQSKSLSTGSAKFTSSRARGVLERCSAAGRQCGCSCVQSWRIAQAALPYRKRGRFFLLGFVHILRQSGLRVRGYRRRYNRRNDISPLNFAMPSKHCEHGRRRSMCKECGGASVCEHGRRRSQCKECGGKGICEHGRLRSQCKECGGASI